MVMNVIWLVVTLVTDFDSAFYRKASVYKRRVDKAAAKRKAEPKQVSDDALTSSRKGSLFGTIAETVSHRSHRDVEENKIRSNSFHQFMMFENL